jgi:2-polyprenyl-6-methoxyphenol hydroxylase-like FAD-dependent oxidoreductase
MGDRAVVIVGGGPTGLMLAGELALAGVDVVVVERRSGQAVVGVRARGLHCRTIEVLDQRGIADRFLAEGRAVQIQNFGGIPLDISEFPTRHPYGLALEQGPIERLLAEWVDELGVQVLRGRDVVGFSEDDDGVVVEMSQGERLRGQYLVGCDGGRSVVRKVAGIDVAGTEASTSWIIAEVEADEEPEIGMRPEGGGIGLVNREEARGSYSVVLTEPDLHHSGDATPEHLRAALVAAYGTDFGVHRPAWISRFTDAARQAVAYRAGRVLLAGDAAHIHPPQGGQGLGTGVQDSVNLGWKLAQVVRGTSPQSLLDSYHAERHPVGARVIRTVLAQVALGPPDDRHQALRDTVAELLTLAEPRNHMAAMLCGLDVRYDSHDGPGAADRPLVGRRMPDLDLATADGPTRVFSLLQDARPVLVGFQGLDGVDVSAWKGRVRSVDARYEGPWELPVLGRVSAPAAVLIRPDGHVAWAGDLTDPDLPRTMESWFGPPTPRPPTE